MKPSRVDRAFERYRASGSPRALAVVFDGTATELYRLAWHLVGDRHAAEDLVQTTFLVAMERSATFEPGREVMPWLCGILANRAREVRRRRRRLRQQRRKSNEPIADPAAEAAARELEQTLWNRARFER